MVKTIVKSKRWSETSQ